MVHAVAEFGFPACVASQLADHPVGPPVTGAVVATPTFAVLWGLIEDSRRGPCVAAPNPSCQ